MKRAVCLIAVLCVAASVPRAALADRDDIDELLDRYVAAYNHGDAEAMATLFDEDGWLMPLDRDAIQGKNKIQGFWRRSFTTDPAHRNRRMSPASVMVKHTATDLAYVVGFFGGRLDEAHNFTLCLKRNPDGKWRITADVWNSGSMGPRFQPAA